LDHDRVNNLRFVEYFLGEPSILHPLCEDDPNEDEPNEDEPNLVRNLTAAKLAGNALR
jgi:hypothetical protein